jgi:hypothetical protein
MEMNSARKRRARTHPRYHAAWSYPEPEPVQLTSDRARRLRRWGYAAGLAIVAATAVLSWAVTVWTHADAPGTTPSSTNSTSAYTRPAGQP